MELGKKKQRKEKNQQKIQNNDENPENNGIYKLFIDNFLISLDSHVTM